MKKLSITKMADTIIAKRKSLKLTQAQLAEMTNINRGMISRLESCDYTPSIDQLQAIAEVLGFEATDLFEDDNKKEEPKKEAKKEDKKINRGRKVENKETKVNLEELDEEDFILPQEPIHEEEDVYDLQKELEAKFDELFGPLEDN